jgi:hypothetical protein
MNSLWHKAEAKLLKILQMVLGKHPGENTTACVFTYSNEMGRTVFKDFCVS